jgi:adenosylcobinamide-GDP ribazoletransferase
MLVVRAKRKIRRQWAALAVAARFLTQVPVPPGVPFRATGRFLPRALVFFPVVGGMLGLATGGLILGLAHCWSWPLAVMLGVAAEMLVTGAFHEDAVADFCDAFGGGWTRQRILEILKDSRIGTFGTVGLLVGIGLRVGAMIHLAPGDLLPATMAAAAWSRWCILLFMWRLPPIADRASLTRDVGRQATGVSLAIGLALAAPWIAWWAASDPTRCAIGLLAAAMWVLCLERYVRRKLGGVVGDCLGMACYTAQVLVLLAACAGR